MGSKLFPSWGAAKMILPDQGNPSKRIYVFALAAHLTYNLHNLWYTLWTSATASYQTCWYSQHSWYFFKVMNIRYPALNYWLCLRIWYVMWCLLVATISSRRCYHNPAADVTSQSLRPERRFCSQPLCSRNYGNLAGWAWLDNTTDRK